MGHILADVTARVLYGSPVMTVVAIALDTLADTSVISKKQSQIKPSPHH